MSIHVRLAAAVVVCSLAFAGRALGQGLVSGEGSAGASCVESALPHRVVLDAAGGSGTVAVTTTTTDCAWTATSDQSWLTLSGATGTGTGTVGYTVTANTTGSARVANLTVNGWPVIVNQNAEGCTFAISLTQLNATPAARNIFIEVTAPAGCVWQAVPSASFVSVTAGSPGTGSGTLLLALEQNTGPARIATVTIADQTLTITQAGPCSAALNFTSLSVIPAGVMTAVNVTVGSGCAWTATSQVPWIVISSGSSGSGNGSVAFSVGLHLGLTPRVGTLTVAGHTVTITQRGQTGFGPDRSYLNFAAVSSGAAFLSKTGSQVVRLTQPGAGTVSWTAVTDSPWVVVSPASGVGPGSFTVDVTFVAGLPAVSEALIRINPSGEVVAPVSPITVRLNVTAAGTSTAPVGSFDTPLDGTAGVTGSVAVTGWAMDDVQVTRVRIERDPVAGEAPGARIYIGDASFVDGARPDVAAGFPTSPMNTRGGWGYLLLTNFLPNLGNGTFTLYALADDADGHTTLLGTRTITCTNATATNPFGAIDTPDQGATVSGLVNNFGWVLAPGSRRADPLNGGTVHVVIDGAVVGSPAGWVGRPDLSALFPVAQFSGVGNALGVYTFDSTTLSNGVHTISWVVTDDQGGAAGIGSRYFTVSNSASVQLAPQSAVVRRPSDEHTVVGRRGPDLTGPFGPVDRDSDGVLRFAAEELDRVELRIAALQGHLRTALGDRPLPIGSRLEPLDGTFTWQAGPGFVGTYELVFETPRGQQVVRLTLYPQGMLSRPQVIIDTPVKDEGTTAGFIVAGWAVDPTAASGPGIDAIHVWAYPAVGGFPVFLGAAALTGERPDVADIYGRRALKSGYGVRVDSLPPGTYDIAVFGWSPSARGFLPAKTVRIRVR